MFRAEHPQVELMLRVSPSSQLLELLVSGDLDLVVSVNPTEPLPGIKTEPLLSEDLAVYGPPGERIGAPSSWGPWVLFPSGSHTRSIIVERLAQLGAPLDVVAESHQPEVLREMVHLETGWTVLPTSQGEHGDRPLANGRQLTTRQLVLATRSGSVHDPVVDELAESLRQASM
jgi:DNA-binding transcriptional LysR family regulator